MKPLIILWLKPSAFLQGAFRLFKTGVIYVLHERNVSVPSRQPRQH